MQNENNIKKAYSDIECNYSHPKREDYLRFCANIKHYLGLKVSSSVFMSLMQVRYFNNLILENGINDVILNVIKPKLPDSPSIFVTLHLGCYNIIPAYLLSIGKKVCIPVTKRVYYEQVSIYKKAFVKFISNKNADIKFVNIESSAGFIELLRSVKNGYSLLVYIDGNSGVGGMERKDDKLMTLEFFNNPILIRKGIGFLSLKLGLNINLIYNYVSDDLKTCNLLFMDSLSYCEFNNEEQLITAIWKSFNKPIFHHFEQWEPWLYADSYYIQTEKNITKDNSYTFNFERFSPIIKNNNFYFYDNILNKLIHMRESTFNFLLRAYEKSHTISIEDLSMNVSPTVKEQLISMHLLK